MRDNLCPLRFSQLGLLSKIWIPDAVLSSSLRNILTTSLSVTPFVTTVPQAFCLTSYVIITPLELGVLLIFINTHFTPPRIDECFEFAAGMMVIISNETLPPVVLGDKGRLDQAGKFHTD